MPLAVQVLAAGFASKFEAIGPYLGFASVIAVAAMAFLVLSQGRELARLRDWAGDRPERGDDLGRPQIVQVQQTPANQGQPAGAGPANPAQINQPGVAQNPQGIKPGQPGFPKPPVPGQPGAGSSFGPQGTAALAAGATERVLPDPSNAVTPGQATPPRPTPPSTPVLTGSRSDGDLSIGTRGVTGREREFVEHSPKRRSVGSLIGGLLIGGVILAALLFALGVFKTGTNTDAVEQDNSETASQVRVPVPEFSAADTSVVVLNASGKDQIALKTATKIQTKRFDVNKAATGNLLDPTNGAKVERTTTIVAYSDASGNKQAAASIAALLGLPKTAARAMDTQMENGANGKYDVVVVIGKDFGTTSASSTTTDTTTTGTAASSSSTATATSTTATSNVLTNTSTTAP